MIELTQGEIETYYRARVPGLRKIQGAVRGPCPVHSGKDLNFSLDTETGRSFCHSQCNRGWDVFSLEMELGACDFVAAKAMVYEIVGRPKDDWQDRDIVAAYDYANAEGVVVYQVVRKTPGIDGRRRFMQRVPQLDGKWKWGLGNVAAVPFRLPQMLEANVVAIAEGEKDCMNLARAGWVATCNNGGAGNFKPELVPYFADKHVAIFPDNDEPGRKHAESVARILAPVAASVKIVEIPDLPLKGDVSDFLEAGKTGSDLRQLWRDAQEWTPEWEFVSEVPHENDKYLRTFAQSVREAGGFDEFWKSVEVEGIPTPFPSLTARLKGLRPGEVYVIGARPGQGKTSLALQFAGTAIANRVPPLLFSMEMGHRDAFQRMAGIEARADLTRYAWLRKHHPTSIDARDIERDLRHATEKFSRVPFYVTTKTGVTPEFLVAESKRMKDRAGIGLVIVDHMQLMGATGKLRGGDYEKFTAISRATKEIAVELNVPLILVSQVSRNSASDKRAELEMNDLRGSGAIEEDAAGIMLLYYDAEDFAQAKNDPQRMAAGPIRTWLKLAKNRFGSAGTYEELWHHKALTRFDQGGAE
jgi:KaiC/GvpD/RAD55 family RecA-like ATPase